MDLEGSHREPSSDLHRIRRRSVPIDFIAKRTLQLLLIVFIAVTVNFLIPRMIPGDPVESALRSCPMTWAADKPCPTTSPTAAAMRSPGRSTRSYQSPQTFSVSMAGR